MVKRDDGPLDTVGWGPFALFGERKRLRLAEARRLAAVTVQEPRVEASDAAKDADAPSLELRHERTSDLAGSAEYYYKQRIEAVAADTATVVQEWATGTLQPHQAQYLLEEMRDRLFEIYRDEFAAGRSHHQIGDAAIPILRNLHTIMTPRVPSPKG